MSTWWRRCTVAIGAALVLAPVQAAPVEDTRGPVGVLHGGIGAEARAAMASRAPRVAVNANGVLGGERRPSLGKTSVPAG